MRSTVVGVRVLYFAGLREALGVAEEWVELPPGATTIAQLASTLADRHPAYRERRAHVRIARNEAFAEADEAVVEGDVVALIPPVSGG
jgi:molybdopterin converting factor subunit 1